ncbi:hypothetical protein B0T24DRAFT_668962 [Lasiosphaeria ovina]|uniref:Uncharacterized protein n=1 Tax=Lasiosphaeria ovina TaxID=92902 RepID=A0AAE0N445_9PEZI|nr:hypothetical protein B0T24DRAFT_668962 [Lasiosphaeria ovina]
MSPQISFSADELLVDAINGVFEGFEKLAQALEKLAQALDKGFETLAGLNWTTIVLAVVGIVGLVIAVRGWRTCLFGHMEEGGRRSGGLLRLLLGWLRRLVGWVTGFLATQDGADTANAGRRPAVERGRERDERPADTVMSGARDGGGRTGTEAGESTGPDSGNSI